MTSDDDPFRLRVSPDAISRTAPSKMSCSPTTRKPGERVDTSETPARFASNRGAKEFAAVSTRRRPKSRSASVEAQVETTKQAVHSCCLLPLQGDGLARTPPRLPCLRTTRIRSQLSSRPITNQGPDDQRRRGGPPIGVRERSASIVSTIFLSAGEVPAHHVTAVCGRVRRQTTVKTDAYRHFTPW